MNWEDWFLTAEERGNPSTKIDTRRGDGLAWTEGNLVCPLVDGASYFAALLEKLQALRAGDELRFTDWRGDRDELLTDAGPTIGDLLGEVARRGVDVRGLLWKSHSDQLAFSAEENRHFATVVERNGGEVLLDERVRRGGSHHQKLVIVRHPDEPHRDSVFVGGIDLAHGRRDDHSHRGDRQATPLEVRYGERPPWHDLQVEACGPVVSDFDFTFRERWDDPAPLDYSSRVRPRFASRHRRSRSDATPLPSELPDPPACGTHAVQVLRTYPIRRPGYPFALDGERSVARAFAKAVPRARRFIYIEDQYFWSADAAEHLADALRRNKQLEIIAVVPRYPERDGAMTGTPSRLAQHRAMQMLFDAGGVDRVAVYDLENDTGAPVYVHAKTCIIDDVWATVGSDNLNRRSWSHDSEVACAVVDDERDVREPLDPGGRGDGARRFARDLRLGLWAEHLALPLDDASLLDPGLAFSLWRDTAAALTAWHDDDERGVRPPGHVRVHESLPVSALHRPWADAAYMLMYDPDGRPRRLRRSRTY